jgi:hypothetical protein
MLHFLLPWQVTTSLPPLLLLTFAAACLFAAPLLQMPEQQLLQLDELCRAKGVKLLVVRSYGLLGYMRVSLVGM